MNHDIQADICPACGVKCVHVENLTPRKRGPKPKPHARREKLTIYVSKALRLAIMERYKTDNISVVINHVLENLFPEHKSIAERIAKDGCAHEWSLDEQGVKRCIGCGVPT